jgi:hypothetical protein
MSTLKTALDLVGEKVQGLINDYREDLEKAWLKRDDKEDLTLSFGAKFGLDKGNNVCIISISFTPEKITDKARFTWDDKQPALPGIEKGTGALKMKKKLRP